MHGYYNYIPLDKFKIHSEKALYIATFNIEFPYALSDCIQSHELLLTVTLISLIEKSRCLLIKKEMKKKHKILYQHALPSSLASCSSTFLLVPTCIVTMLSTFILKL